MKRRMCYILMATLIFSSLVCVMSKHYLSPFGDANQQELFKPSTKVDQTTRIQDVPTPASVSTQVPLCLGSFCFMHVCVLLHIICFLELYFIHKINDR
ncbi:hypothetical protein Lalb_Chr08g0232361 [Lupinus albus]|uniref:Uncharacterized protein n=1 Tax=Lupinus albus TaxID=3870 RepID=A0A6A4Q3H8_LUPAL|nr:hypothetical protein Lalb_Chr08g0232361 [Lupinus albus]